MANPFQWEKTSFYIADAFQDGLGGASRLQSVDKSWFATDSGNFREGLEMTARVIQAREDEEEDMDGIAIKRSEVDAGR